MVVAFSLLITIILFLFGNQLLSLFLDPEIPPARWDMDFRICIQFPSSIS